MSFLPRYNLGGLIVADDFNRANVTSAGGTNIGAPAFGPAAGTVWGDPYAGSSPSSGGIASNRVINPLTNAGREFRITTSPFNNATGVATLLIDGTTGISDSTIDYYITFRRPSGFENQWYSAQWSLVNTLCFTKGGPAGALGGTVVSTTAPTAGHDIELRVSWANNGGNTACLATATLWDVTATPNVLLGTTSLNDATYLVPGNGVGFGSNTTSGTGTGGRIKQYALYNPDIEAGTSITGAVRANSTAQTVTLSAPTSGPGAANWTTLAPVFSVLTPSGTVVSGVTQSVTSAGVATVTFNPAATAGNYIIQDATTTLQWTSTVGAAAITEPVANFPSTNLVVSGLGDGVATVTAAAPVGAGTDTITYQFFKDTVPTVNSTTGVSLGAASSSNSVNLTGLTNGVPTYVLVRVRDVTLGTFVDYYQIATVVSAKVMPVLFLGDSEIGGANGLSNTLPAANGVINLNNPIIMAQQVAAMTGGAFNVATTVSGVGGSTTTQWISGSTNLNTALTAGASAGCKTAIIELGTNNGNASVFLADMTNIVNTLITNGYTKIMLLYVPFHPISYINNQYYLTMNSLIDTLVASFASSNPGVVVSGSNKHYSALAQNVANWSGDGTHMSPLGAVAWGTAWAQSFVQNVLGITGASTLPAVGVGTDYIVTGPIVPLPALTRAQAIAIINSGGSVELGNRVYSRIVDLPGSFV